MDAPTIFFFSFVFFGSCFYVCERPMTTLLFLTHGTAVFAGFIIGIALARWAIKPNINPDRFWNGR